MVATLHHQSSLRNTILNLCHRSIVEKMKLVFLNEKSSASRVDFVRSHSIYISLIPFPSECIGCDIFLLSCFFSPKRQFNCLKWNESNVRIWATCITDTCARREWAWVRDWEWEKEGKEQREQSERYGKYNKMSKLNRRQGCWSSVIFQINASYKMLMKRTEGNRRMKTKGEWKFQTVWSEIIEVEKKGYSH